MNNRIIRSIILLLSPFMLLQGCLKKDVINLSPEFALDALKNPSSMQQVEEVLLGAYASLRNANYYGSGSGTGAGWAIMPDVMSDNLYESTSETLANSRTMADWLYNSSTAQVYAFYQVPYVTIAHSNIILRDIDKFITPANQLRANRIKGQAYALRAMAHFDLMRYFATSYNRTSTTDLAMTYSKEFIVSTTYQPARNNNKDYYDNLLSDITEAINLLGNVDQPVNPATGQVRPYIDRNAAYAIAARIHLYAGNWADAVTAATNALNGRPLATTQSAFSGMYNQTDRGEIIWNIQFEAGQSGPTFLMYFVTSNRPYFRPAPEIAVVGGGSGLIRSNDIRFNAFFKVITYGITSGLCVTKYSGKGTANDGVANFPVFRSGELYLIRAEAYARQGGANEALGMADLNTLRAARISGYTNENLTGAALLDAIANERRRELVAEGHRFFDLKRTTRTIQRGSICGTTPSAAGDCILLPADREWNLPMPDQVRNPNPNQAQNPGYN